MHWGRATLFGHWRITSGEIWRDLAILPRRYRPPVSAYTSLRHAHLSSLALHLVACIPPLARSADRARASLLRSSKSPPETLRRCTLTRGSGVPKIEITICIMFLLDLS